MPSTGPPIKYKVGDKVLLNTMSRPDLLGQEATVMQVNRDGKVIIQMDQSHEEFLTGPNAVIPSHLGYTPGINTVAPKNLHRIYLKESSEPVINRCLTMRRNVSFDYTDLHGNYTVREVEPHVVFQAAGTLNELLLSKDWVMREGAWRCFRVNAMLNSSPANRFSFDMSDMLNDVDNSLKVKISKIEEKYPNKNEAISHMIKNNVVRGLKAYKQKLIDDMKTHKQPHEVHTKTSNIMFQPHFL